MISETQKMKHNSLSRNINWCFFLYVLNLNLSFAFDSANSKKTWVIKMIWKRKYVVAVATACDFMSRELVQSITVAQELE